MNARATAAALGEPLPEAPAQVAALVPSVGPAWQVVTTPVAAEPRSIPNPARAVRAGMIAEYRRSIIAPMLALPKKSRARGECARALSARAFVNPLSEKPERFSVATLYEWAAEVERTGTENCLRPKLRPRRARRVLISRGWDLACPLPDETKRAIAAGLATHVGGLWRLEFDGWKKISEVASSWLAGRCKENGWIAASAINCKVPRKFIEREELKDARRLGIKERDAKTYHDKHEPRIVRTRENLYPLEIVCVDVCHLDIYVKRDDGSLATPKVIGWLDIATGVFLSYTLKLCEKREGVRQTDLSLSFVDFVTQWGLPGRIQEDNGSENGDRALRQGFGTLREILGVGGAGQHPYMTAIPHSPTAKLIELFWGALKEWLRPLPGFIGGDRMNKRTPKMGRQPEPFDGSFGDFEAVFGAAVAGYNNTPQRGALGGLSPNEMLKKKQAELAAPDANPAAYRPLAVGRELCSFAFGQKRRATITSSGVEVNGIWYCNEALIPLNDKKREIVFAKWAPESIFVLDGARYIVVKPAPVYGYGDPAGAKERQRLARVARSYEATLAANFPKLNAPAVLREHAETLPAQPAPQTFGKVTLGAETDAAIKQAHAVAAALPAPEAAPARPLERINRRTGGLTRIVPDSSARRRDEQAKRETKEREAAIASNGRERDRAARH